MPFAICIDSDQRPAISPVVSRTISSQLELACRRLRGPNGERMSRADTVGLRFVGAREMSRLHRVHMSLPGATDVLSFPAAAVPEQLGSQHLGDIVVCWPINVVQSSALHRDPVEHSLILSIHGCAHLLGHDHAQPHEARLMHRTEARMLARIGLADIPRAYARGV